jgi:hypothetical protein
MNFNTKKQNYLQIVVLYIILKFNLIESLIL